MENSILYSSLTRFGDYYPLKLNNSCDDSFIDNLETQFDWVQYNPRKQIDRWGLSITSLDGGISGRPDLDSLYEHYSETGNIYNETDFRTKTPVYKYFEESLSPLSDYLGRTHLIKLNRGAYFPPHRDNKHLNIETFRLFLPLNYDTKNIFFLLEDKKMNFDNGKMYFIDTAKMHTLFNTRDEPFYFVVANIILTKESVEKTLRFIYG